MKVIPFVFLVLVASLRSAPEHLIFTYRGNPSTSLTLNWQYLDVPAGEAPGDLQVLYDTQPHNGELSAYAHRSAARALQINGLNERWIARAELADLEPATTYYVVAGNVEHGYSNELKVRTIPTDDSALRFVTGGDMGVDDAVGTLLRHAASYDPDFAVVGGDIAYSNGRLDAVGLWDTWLKYYTESMVTSDGRAIPLVLAIGNHEVAGGFNRSSAEAPFFFGFFAQEATKSYFARQFGANFLLCVLDSGHVATHVSQVDWLDATLSAHRSVKYKSAVYHVPLYPSHRDFMGHFSDEGRRHWAPVFDAHALTVAFENHDHTYKRSYPIRHGDVQTAGEGTLYLGDGCWGRSPRPIDLAGRPYLEKSGSLMHFWVVDVTSEQMTYRAIDLENKVFDSYPDNLAEADAYFVGLAQLYSVPDGIVRVSGIRNAASPWHKGHAEVIIKNTFDYPLAYSARAITRRAPITARGLPEGVLRLEPGELVAYDLALTANPAEGLPLEKAKVSIAVEMEVFDPSLPAGTRFEGDYNIPFESAD